MHKLDGATPSCRSASAALDYEIKTTDAIEAGETRVYGSEGSPAIQITVTDAGYTSDGYAIDVVFTISTVSIYGYRAANNVCVTEFEQGEDLFADGFWLSAHYGGVYADCTVSIYYSGTDTLARGYDIVWKVVDLDIASYAGTTGYGGTYSEAILFKSGFTNPVYVTSDTTTATDLYQYDGTQYTRIYGTAADNTNAALKSGFITKVSGGEFSFVWIGSSCGTKIALASTQASLEFGSLTITKEVSGDATDAQRADSYSFTVTLTDTSGNPVSGDYIATYHSSDGTTTTSTITFTDGKIAAVDGAATNTIFLTSDQRVTISGISRDVGYTVVEDTSNITGTCEVWINGSVIDDATATGTITGGGIAEVTFDNHFETGALIISKTVSGDGANTSDSFTFMLTLTDDNDNPVSGEYAVTLPDGSTGTATFVGGTYTFTLTHGQSLIITDLPAGTNYTVGETAVDGYSTSINNESGNTTSGTISAVVNSVAAFHNHNDFDPNLEIKKKTTNGATSAEAGDTVEYTLAITQTTAGAIAKNIVVTDELSEGLTHNEDSVVVKIGDTELTGLAITTSDNTLTIEGIEELSYGETLTITYTVTMADDYDGTALINTATVTSEDDPGGDKDEWTLTCLTNDLAPNEDLECSGDDRTVAVGVDTVTETDYADTTTDDALPQTGDTTNTLPSLYAAIVLGLAAAALFAGLVLRRRDMS